MKIFAIGLIGAMFLAPPQTFKPDTDGFIRNWLILAPIVFDVSGAEAIEHRFLDDEPATKPKPGESVVIINTPLTWKAHQASDYFVDFLQAFPQPGEQVAAYAVTYVTADNEMKVTLALGTNDQGKAWLNGKEVFKFTETRVLEKDANRVRGHAAQGPERAGVEGRQRGEQLAGVRSVSQGRAAGHKPAHRHGTGVKSPRP